MGRFGIPVKPSDDAASKPACLGLDEAILDSVIHALYVEQKGLWRSLSISTDIADIEFKVITALTGEDAIRVWQMIKGRIRSSQVNVPMIMLVTEEDADFLGSIQAITIFWKVDHDSGSTRLLERLTGVDCEFVMRIPPFLRSALTQAASARHTVSLRE